MTIMLPSLMHTIIPSSFKPPLSAKMTPTARITAVYSQSMDEFLQELWTQFEKPLSTTNLLGMSSRLQQQFTHRLQTCKNTMLPSYIHTLPSGNERGNYLALDVGGSTFRVALVKLDGTPEKQNVDIKRMTSSVIDNAVRGLEGREFFAWMATKISEMLADYDPSMAHGPEALPMGLAWSFPVEQTSHRSGKLHTMGKGLLASRGLEGKDLAGLIIDACRTKGLNVRMDAIVNDSSATLLSRAYFDPSTRMALILGTGSNAAVHIPVNTLHPSKFGTRPASWHDKACNVLVNTEFSMCGAGILPTTPWDDYLDAHHPNPGYQPYEHMLSGRYLGEIVRLILLDAVRTCGLFGGAVPPSLLEAYTLDTRIVASIESDTSPSLSASRDLLTQRHPLPNSHSYTSRDIHHVRAACRMVSHRATALLAVAMHALWSLCNSADGLSGSDIPHLSIACNGSVIERYPEFRARTTQTVNDLAIASGAAPGSIDLEIAGESAIIGAAVAAAVADADEALTNGVASDMTLQA